MLSRRKFLKLSLAAGGGILASRFPGFSAVKTARAQALMAPSPPLVAQTPMPGSMIPQFVQKLPGLDVAVDDGSEIKLHMREFVTNVLQPGFLLPNGKAYTGTHVWGYLREDASGAVPGTRTSYLGPLVVAERGKPTRLRIANELGDTANTNVLAYKNSVDQTLHWADPLGGGKNMCAHMPSQTPSMGCEVQYQGPIPAAVHLHGGEVPPELDGGPDSWFTSLDADGNALHGGGYYSGDGAAPNEVILNYPNEQEPGLIWFHDHTLGATRLNVYAGLAGGHFIQDTPNGVTLGALPTVIPLVIQDRMFDTNGELYFPAGVPFVPNPDHPLWVPEFIGDTIVVNGAAWPFVEVKQQRYTFAVVNGSNARTYEMFLINPVTKVMGPPIWQIATDGGLLDKPVKIDPNAAVLPRLVMMPGERAIIIIDFGALPVGTTLILKNVARAPYPAGATPNGNTTGRIVQFRVVAGGPLVDKSYNPATLTPLRGANAATKLPAIVRLVNPATGAPAAGVKPSVTRRLTLNEVMGMPVTLNGVVYPGGPLEILVNNTKWTGEYQTGMSSWSVDPNLPQEGGILDRMGNHLSEFPKEGAIELWEFVNLTADAHPMHTHLTQFQLLSRQNFDVKKYQAAYAFLFPGGGFDMMTGLPFPPKVFMPGYGSPLPYDVKVGGAVGGNPDPKPFLKGPLILPNANEAGWKDTVLTPPGMITRFLVRYAPMDKALDDPNPFYAFDPGSPDGYAYVWHCHIVDHEDNEMMRPLRVDTSGTVTTRTFVKGAQF